MRVYLAAIAMSFLSLFVFVSRLPASCFPESVSFHPVSMAGGISESQFNAQISILEKVYGPEIKAMGFELKVNRLWKDGTYNSNTTLDGNVWEINAYGGLARFRKGKVNMTEAGYLTVLCHELGHHMGGAPRFNDNSEWASVEGAADYWATMICMKRLDPKHAEAGALNLGDVLAALGGSKHPHVNTPDLRVVTTTFEDHPEAQCRLDTYIAGLNCPVENGLMSPVDPSRNSCFSYPSNSTYALGSRPRCWFSPGSNFTSQVLTFAN